MSKLLLVDHSNLFWRSFHAYPHLSHDGMPTGAIFGFVAKLVELIRELDPTDIVVALDKPPYLRKKDCRDFKADRKKMDEDVLEASQAQKKPLYNILKNAGIQVSGRKGYEADDVIAYCADQYASDYDEILCYSNDSDLNQLLVHDNVTLVRGKHDEQYTYKDFKEAYPDLEPHDWVLMTALEGGHNGVPGFTGIGPKSAYRLVIDGHAAIQEKLLINALRDEIPKEDKKARAKVKVDLGDLSEHERHLLDIIEDKLEMNKHLAGLPYKSAELDIPIKQDKLTQEYDGREFVKALAAYGIAPKPFLLPVISNFHSRRV